MDNSVKDKWKQFNKVGTSKPDKSYPEQFQEGFNKQPEYFEKLKNFFSKKKKDEEDSESDNG